jgi:hypothetical protein
MDLLTQLMQQFAQLGGFAALVTVLVNALKIFGIVGDEMAPQWVLGLNLLGLVAMYFAQLVKFDLARWDPALGSLAQILTLVLALFSQTIVSKIVHWAIRGIPVIGTSYTLRALKSQSALRRSNTSSIH